eukprot:718460_1
MADIFICDENNKKGIILYNYIVPITYTFCAITMIPPMVLFARIYPTSNLQVQSKLVLWSGFALFAAVFLYLISASIASSLYCHNHAELYLIQASVALVLHWIQASILLQLLFYRLYFIYKNTILSLSTCAIRVWIIYYIFTSVLFICGIVAYVGSESYSAYGVGMAATGSILAALSTVWLVGAFIYRLLKIHKVLSNGDGNEDDTEEQINVVIKMSLLCFISAFIYLLDAVTAPFLISKTIYLDFIWRMITLADVYSSFVCILLSYRQSEVWYQRMCHWCHMCCYSLCTKTCFKNEDSTTSVGPTVNSETMTNNTTVVGI